VSDRSGVVFDLGYSPHEGPRLGRLGAVRAVIKDGVRRVLGLRRRARRKVLPWLLFSIALLPAAVFVGLAFFVGTFSPEAESPFGGHVEYIGLVGTLVMLFIALAGPELLIPDREEGVLAVYSSRPLTVGDYLLARAGAMAIVVAAFMIVPNLLMYIGFAAIDEGGFASTLASNADDLLRILGATAAYLFGYGAPAFLIATYAKRNGPATGVYLALMIGSAGVASALSEAGNIPGGRWGALLSIYQHPEIVRSWVFGQAPGPGSVPTNAGFEPWASLATIVVVTLLTAALTHRRYRRLM